MQYDQSVSPSEYSEGGSARSGYYEGNDVGSYLFVATQPPASKEVAGYKQLNSFEQVVYSDNAINDAADVMNQLNFGEFGSPKQGASGKR
jgi:hypothetical protein